MRSIGLPILVIGVLALAAVAVLAADADKRPTHLVLNDVPSSPREHVPALVVPAASRLRALAVPETYREDVTEDQDDVVCEDHPGFMRCGPRSEVYKRDEFERMLTETQLSMRFER